MQPSKLEAEVSESSCGTRREYSCPQRVSKQKDLYSEYVKCYVWIFKLEGGREFYAESNTIPLVDGALRLK